MSLLSIVSGLFGVDEDRARELIKKSSDIILNVCGKGTSETYHDLWIDEIKEIEKLNLDENEKYLMRTFIDTVMITLILKDGIGDSIKEICGKKHVLTDLMLSIYLNDFADREQLLKGVVNLDEVDWEGLKETFWFDREAFKEVVRLLCSIDGHGNLEELIEKVKDRPNPVKMFVGTFVQTTTVLCG